MSGVSAAPAIDRRSQEGRDRRARSRGGRRAEDPRGNWKRIAWLFAVYAVYLSIRSLPSTMKRLFDRQRTAS